MTKFRGALGFRRRNCNSRELDFAAYQLTVVKIIIGAENLSPFCDAMKRPDNLLRNALILLLLISLGIASRFVLLDIPNFKPVAAIVLFAAFWFRSYWVAGVSLLAVMALSNSGLDHCPWQVTLGVVSGLGVAVWSGRRLGNRFGDVGEVSRRPLSAIANLFGAAFLMSATFFLISNLAVWSMGSWYPLSLSGMAHCFAAAVPFFKYTFGGDLFFSGAIFGVWYAVERLTCRSRQLAVGQV